MFKAPGDFHANVSMGEVAPTLLFAKFIGALAGSFISIAYVLPKGRREAFLRLSVGMVTGIVFGGPAGMKAADALGLLDKISVVEMSLMGATLASLCAWWVLGVAQRLAERWPDRLRAIPPRDPNQTGHQQSKEKTGEQ